MLGFSVGAVPSSVVNTAPNFAAASDVSVVARLLTLLPLLVPVLS